MKRGRILVVEDEGITAHHIQLVLEGYGHEVPAICISGEDALAKVEALRPDLVLLDIHLKGTVDGMSVAETLHRQGGPPIVFLTANADAATVARAARTEAYGYLLKPFSEQELHSTIQLALYKADAERARAERQEWFHKLVVNSSDLIAVTDSAGVMRFMSPSVTRILGYEADELTGRTIGELVHPDDRAAVEQALRLAQATPGGNSRVEGRVWCEDSYGKILELQATNYLDDPVLAGVVINARDVTERREAETALRASEARLRLIGEERLRQVVDGIGDYGVVMLDEAGQILTWNVGAERISGYAREQAVGQPFWFMYLDEDLQRGHAAAELGEAYTIGRAAREQWRRHRDGTLYWSEEVLTAVHVGGEQAGLVKLFHDSTERRQMEMSLRESEERYRLVLRASDDVIFDYDVETDVTIWGDALGRVFGEAGISSPARRQSWFERIHPDDQPNVQRSYLAAGATGGEVWRGEYRFRREDGEFAAVLSRAYLLRDAEARVRRMVGSITDVSERQRREEELRAARDAAQAGSRAKSDFLAVMSHELRTPLNAIIGFSNVLRRNTSERLTTRELDHVERIRDNGIHLLGLVNGVLDLARVEAGRIEVVRQPVALGSLLRRTIEQLGTANGVPIVLELPAVPVAVLNADEEKLRQVLINLIGNARKFTPDGRVTVRLVADVNSGEPLRIEVTDTGIGIPPERQAAIFEPFEQADDSTSRTFGGTGMGLAIARALCQAMGFDLGLTSEVGRGSTFSIALAPDEPPGKEIHRASPNKAR